VVGIVDRQRGRRVGHDAIRSAVLGAAAIAPPPAATAELAVALVSDRRMREFNRRWRGRDTSTDVLSFPGDGAPGPDGLLALGDVVISIPTAERQARDAGHGLDREIATLAVHGYLHLLGYDHERDDGTMRRLERRILRRVLPSPGRR